MVVIEYSLKVIFEILLIGYYDYLGFNWVLGWFLYIRGMIWIDLVFKVVVEKVFVLLGGFRSFVFKILILMIDGY